MEKSSIQHIYGTYIPQIELQGYVMNATQDEGRYRVERETHEEDIDAN